MADERAVTGEAFSCFHAGPMASWRGAHSTRLPISPEPARGKLFLRELLDLGGLEASINAYPPGGGYPFLHRHKLNEEVYVVLGGRGQFVIDGRLLDVSEGSVVRVSPRAARSFKNTGDGPAYVLVLQYRAGGAIEGTIRDGELVPGPLPWADA